MSYDTTDQGAAPSQALGDGQGTTPQVSIDAGSSNANGTSQGPFVPSFKQGTALTPNTGTGKIGLKIKLTLSKKTAEAPQEAVASEESSASGGAAANDDNNKDGEDDDEDDDEYDDEDDGEGDNEDDVEDDGEEEEEEDDDDASSTLSDLSSNFSDVSMSSIPCPYRTDPVPPSSGGLSTSNIFGNLINTGPQSSAATSAPISNFFGTSGGMATEPTFSFGPVPTSTTPFFGLGQTPAETVHQSAAAEAFGRPVDADPIVLDAPADSTPTLSEGNAESVSGLSSGTPAPLGIAQGQQPDDSPFGAFGAFGSVGFDAPAAGDPSSFSAQPDVNPSNEEVQPADGPASPSATLTGAVDDPLTASSETSVPAVVPPPVAQASSPLANLKPETQSASTEDVVVAQTLGPAGTQSSVVDESNAAAETPALATPKPVAPCSSPSMAGDSAPAAPTPQPAAPSSLAGAEKDAAVQAPLSTTAEPIVLSSSAEEAAPEPVEPKTASKKRKVRTGDECSAPTNSSHGQGPATVQQTTQYQYIFVKGPMTGAELNIKGLQRTVKLQEEKIKDLKYQNKCLSQKSGNEGIVALQQTHITRMLKMNEDKYKQIDSLREEISEWRSDADTLVDYITKVQRKAKKLEYEKSNALCRAQQAGDALSSLQPPNEETRLKYEDRIYTLETELRTVSSAQAQLALKLDERTTDLEYQSKEVNKYKSKYEDASASNGRLRDANRSLRCSELKAQLELKAAIAANKVLQAELAEATQGPVASAIPSIHPKPTKEPTIATTSGSSSSPDNTPINNPINTSNGSKRPKVRVSAPKARRQPSFNPIPWFNLLLILIVAWLSGRLYKLSQEPRSNIRYGNEWSSVPPAPFSLIDTLLTIYDTIADTFSSIPWSTGFQSLSVIGCVISGFLMHNFNAPWFTGSRFRNRGVLALPFLAAVLAFWATIFVPEDLVSLRELLGSVELLSVVQFLGCVLLCGYFCLCAGVNRQDHF